MRSIHILKGKLLKHLLKHFERSGLWVRLQNVNCPLNVWSQQLLADNGDLNGRTMMEWHENHVKFREAQTAK